MRQGRGAGSRSKKCCNRRTAASITLPGTLDEQAPPPWKGPGVEQGFGGPGGGPGPASSGPNYGGGGGVGGGPPSGGPAPGGYQSPFPGPPVGAGSPSAGPYSGPPTGSSTPQYTASPAPSGSSTPGPPPGGYPPSSNSAGPQQPPPPPTFNGPSPYGSPGGGPFPPPGRPGSSGPFGHYGSPAPPFGNNFMGPGPGPGPGSPFGPPMGGGPPMPGHNMLSSAPNSIERIEAPPGCFPVHRRHTPYFGQPDVRLYELNKRLQQRTEESDNLWWDAFVTEFFEDDASLTLTFSLEDGAKRYTIGRTLIPRYFRSIFDGGVTELYYILKHPKESFHNTSITLDCDHCTMITHHGKPIYTKVCTEGRLILEFTFDDMMRIKSWHFAVRAYRELVPRSVLGMHSPQHDPHIVDQLSKNITRQGITNSTLNYLRLCVILEPMQELMSRHKAYQLSPRDCLKTTLFQKWQRMVSPPDNYLIPLQNLEMRTSFPESQRPPNKRRKRKGSQSSGAAAGTPGGGGAAGGGGGAGASSKKRSPGPNFSLASQDVMVVGEPSLMGGEFGDEDERVITRLENTQYDAATAANSVDHHHEHGPNHPGPPFDSNAPPGPPNSWPPAGGPPPGPPGPGPGGGSGPPDIDKKPTIKVEMGSVPNSLNAYTATAMKQEAVRTSC